MSEHVVVRIRGKKYQKEYFDAKSKTWTSSKEKATVFTGNDAAEGDMRNAGCHKEASDSMRNRNNPNYICMREDVCYHDGWPLPKS